METQEKGKKRKISAIHILMPITAILLVLVLVANYAMSYFDYIMNSYIGSGSIEVTTAEGTEEWDTDYYDAADMTAEEAAENSRKVCLEVAEEGFVLLKNNENMLPLSDVDKINVFGWAFSHPVYGGTGSGSSDSSTAVSPRQGLEDAGFEVNAELLDTYETWSQENGVTERPGTSTSETFGTSSYWMLPEMPLSDEIVSQAAEYSDTAVVWIARHGGEGQDEAMNMDSAMNGRTNFGYNEDKHYLELTDEEEAILTALEGDSRIKNIIVVINSSNAMELGELENDSNVDAVLYAAAGGSTGFGAVGEILRGTVNPSGKMTDTFYANFKLDPTYQNFSDPDLYETTGPSVNYYGDDDRFENSEEGGTYTYTAFVQYEEGIYLGYRYYETAYEMMKKNSGEETADEWYRGWKDGSAISVGSTTDADDTGVVYPFGYGLSYTDFDWEIISENMDVGVDGTIEIEVAVTNTGSVAGKDVVELYYSAPYTEGGVEKAAVALGAYAKTELLAPGETGTVTLELAVEDMASYDEEHQNSAGTTGCYVLDEGDYTLSLRTDAHTPKNEELILTYTVDSTVEYDSEENKRESDQTVATNAFTDQLSEQSEAMTELSRADWGNEPGEGTFPTMATEEDQIMSDELKEQLMGKTVDGVSMATGEVLSTGTFDPATYDDPEDEMPTTGADVSVQLIDLRGADYDDPAWDTFLDSMTIEEMENMICGGSFATEGIDRLGVPASADNDGPSAIKWQGAAGDVNAQGSSGSSQAMPSEVVMACTWNVDLIEQVGAAIGEEGLQNGVSGWYAPGLDMHRSPFGGRNFEYFSEDPVLSGTMCAAEVSGAASRGIYCYIKHFVMNDQETYRNTDAIGNWDEINQSWRFMSSTDEVTLLTWASEQTIREIYLKAYEIVVKTAETEMKYIADEEGTVETKTIPATTAIMSGFNYIGDTWCGASDALLNTVLRDEWGFEGMVITDAAAYPYMNQDYFIRNGGDLLLAIGQNSLSEETKSSASGVLAMRRAVKNICYTKVNSNAMNNIAPGSIIKTNLAPWQIAGYIAIAVSGIAFIAVWGTAAYRKFGKKRKASV